MYRCLTNFVISLCTPCAISTEPSWETLDYGIPYKAVSGLSYMKHNAQFNALKLAVSFKIHKIYWKKSFQKQNFGAE